MMSTTLNMILARVDRLHQAVLVLEAMEGRRVESMHDFLRRFPPDEVEVFKALMAEAELDDRVWSHLRRMADPEDFKAAVERQRERVRRAEEALFSENELAFLASVIELERTRRGRVTIPQAANHVRLSFDAGKRAASRLGKWGFLRTVRGRAGYVTATREGERLALIEERAAFVHDRLKGIYQ